MCIGVNYEINFFVNLFMVVYDENDMIVWVLIIFVFVFIQVGVLIQVFYGIGVVDVVI